ncbi:MAG: hypothetical protein U0136_13150 [Bdellovibrionota bacterium]
MSSNRKRERELRRRQTLPSVRKEGSHRSELLSPQDGLRNALGLRIRPYVPESAACPAPPALVAPEELAASEIRPKRLKLEFLTGLEINWPTMSDELRTAIAQVRARTLAAITGYREGCGEQQQSIGTTTELLAREQEPVEVLREGSTITGLVYDSVGDIPHRMLFDWQPLSPNELDLTKAAVMLLSRGLGADHPLLEAVARHPVVRNKLRIGHRVNGQNRAFLGLVLPARFNSGGPPMVLLFPDALNYQSTVSGVIVTLASTLLEEVFHIEDPALRNHNYWSECR